MHFLDHFSSHPLKINVRKQTVKENRPKKTVIDLFFKDIFLFSIQDGCKDLIYFDADLDRQDTIFMSKKLNINWQDTPPPFTHHFTNRTTMI